MKKLGLLAAALVVLGSTRVASATILDIFAQPQAGGMGGYGIAGATDAKENDFFKGATGGSYGALVGVKVFFLTGMVEHDQYFTSKLTGTWTQFLLGVDFRFKVGDTPPEGKKHKNFGRISLAGGYGLGTGQQVDPPLDNAQVSDKGFIGQFTFSMEHDFNKVMTFGLALPVEYGYLFKNNAGPANDETQQYQSIHASAYLFLRFHIEIK